jgi:hypothetical protein
MSTQEVQDKQKSKRGRPRKITSDNAVVDDISGLIAKKRGRKRKTDNPSSTSDPNQTLLPINTKSYIVQLKIKSSDLEKIQSRFIDTSQKIGYHDLDDHNNCNNRNCHDNDGIADGKSEIRSSPNYTEYYNLLNKLEVPYKTDPLPNTCTPSGDMPNVPVFYQTITIPILPENVPIKLFGEYQSHQSRQSSLSTDSEDSQHNTNDLLLPLLDNNGAWPDKSPYACWNCDMYFNGTPWGIPEPLKEPIDGKYYCYGNFCSPECVARYLSDRENTIDFWEKYSILCMIYQKVKNMPPETKVMMAPPKESLLKYGGKLSYENYHNVASLDQKVEIYKLPMVPVLLHIGEMYRSTNINNIMQNNTHKQPAKCGRPCKSKKFVPLDPEKITRATENIRQKTDTLLKSNYTLDQCLRVQT